MVTVVLFFDAWLAANAEPAIVSARASASATHKLAFFLILFFSSLMRSLERAPGLPARAECRSPSLR
jgi:hypothetical protein